MNTDLIPTASSDVPAASRRAVVGDYHDVVYGIESVIRSVAIDFNLAKPTQSFLLRGVLAIIPRAERDLLIERLLDMGFRWQQQWADGNEDSATVIHNELADVAMRTARLVAVENSHAVAKYKATFRVLGGVS